MARNTINIFAEWVNVEVASDSEARVWVAESEDAPGLVAEASTREELEEKLKTLIPELLELNAHGRRLGENVSPGRKRYD